MSYARVLVLFCLAAAATRASQADAAEEGRQAKAAMLGHRYEEAVEIYRKIAAGAPDQPEVRFNLALALHSLGRFREAVHELEAIRAVEGSNSRYWFLLGLGYLKLGEPRKAVDPLASAVKLDAANLDANLEYAGALLESGQLEHAERAFRRLAAPHPDLPKVWEGLALSQYGLSRQAFGKLEQHPRAESLLYGLAAVAATEAGQTAKAAELYRRALSSPPLALWMRAELAAVEHAGKIGPAPARCAGESLPCAFSQGHWRNVADAAAKSGNSEALYWSSRAYSQLAREAMETLAALPPSPEQHQMLARAYTVTGRRAEAVAELQRAAQLSPNDPLIREQLARALWSDRQFEQAVEILQPLVARNPDQPEWQFEMGDSLVNLGKPEEAAVHLERAVSLNPDLLPAQAKLGELLLRMGDAAGAVRHLQRAESLDQDGSLHYQLAQAYRHLGQTEAASHALARQRELQQERSRKVTPPE